MLAPALMFVRHGQEVHDEPTQERSVRPLTDDERRALERVSRAQRAPAAQVIRANLLLAVADGMRYLEAAHAVGRRSNDAVSHLVSRFNQAGLAALELHQAVGQRSRMVQRNASAS
jgi:Helix-turn-helix domain